MLSQLSKFVPEVRCVFNSTYTRLCPIEVEKNGELVRVSEFKEFDTAEANKPFHYQDFSIVNLLAVGALNNASPVVLGNTSSMTFVDEFSKSVANVQPSQE